MSVLLGHGELDHSATWSKVDLAKAVVEMNERMNSLWITEEVIWMVLFSHSLIYPQWSTYLLKLFITPISTLSLLVVTCAHLQSSQNLSPWHACSQLRATFCLLVPALRLWKVSFTGAIWCPVSPLVLFVGGFTVFRAHTSTCGAEEGVSEEKGFPVPAPLFTAQGNHFCCIELWNLDKFASDKD